MSHTNTTNARGDAAAQSTKRPVVGLRSSKIQGPHLDRLAIVYVRQSSPQQVLEHRESTARQYALADHAVALGWPAERVVVIDEDQGQSGKEAESRSGFQRILAEVTLEHAGIILGLEMSRLARSSKDWHHLFEVCGLFGTLLGLKGIMNEMELYTLRNRLDRGKLNKAQRGELFLHLPIGYLKLPSGEVVLEPDEQARLVVQLIFDKLDELGTVDAVFRYLVRSDIRLGIRPHNGPNRGQLEWRRPCLATLFSMFHHPFYAGTYAYGRTLHDPRRRIPGRRGSAQVSVPMDQWKVLIYDHLPAYITWERYLKNQTRLEQNRSRPGSPGVPREGPTLLSGILICGKCDSHMRVHYDASKKKGPRYSCQRHRREGRSPACKGLKASVIDELVGGQVLRALQPAALELSLKVGEDIQQERDRLAKHWKQQLERARHDSERAERQYQAVDPENRLVARTLEQRWEQMLLNERQIKDDYDRFLQEKPPQLTDEERELIRSLSADIPTLWKAPRTTAADRQEIVRCLVDRVVATVQEDTEHLDVTIHWAGDFVSQHEIIRPVARYDQLRDFDELMDHIVELREAGLTSAEIAEKLNQQGFRPPKYRATFNQTMVRQLLSRRGLSSERANEDILGPDEWWLSDLADKLEMCKGKLRDWIRREWIHSRKSPIRGYWIPWADDDELDRLRRLRAHTKASPFHPYPSVLTTLKRRTDS